MDPPLQPSRPPSHSPSPSTPNPAGLKASYPVNSGLLAAKALLHHNRRVEGLSRSSAPKKRMSIRDAAAKWNASRSTVARHLRSLLDTNAPAKSDRPAGRPRALTKPEEEALAAFCVYLAQGNCMGNIPLVHTAANELRRRRNPPVGPCHRRWVCRWLMEREDLALRNIPRADRQYRVEGEGDVVVGEFFDRYFAEKMEGDRRALEERLAANGAGRVAAGGSGSASAETRARPLAQEQRPQRQMALDPRLVGSGHDGNHFGAPGDV